MKKKILWVSMTLLIVVALILASCTPDTTTEEKPTTVTGTVTGTTPAPEIEKPTETTYEEKPQYGGIATLALSSDVTAFDEATGSHPYVTSLKLTNEELLQGDWTKGPAGTSETSFIHGGVYDLRFKTGALADTWDIPEPGTWVFHIREGVYWHNKAPTNGRELTVDDVVFSIKRMCTSPGAYIKMAFPKLASTAEITGDEATRMVTIKVPREEWGNAYTLFPDFLTIVAKDAVEQFGDAGMNDWRNSIGTGPFILTNYVSNGSATFIRNDNYWMTNPIGPGKGDRLPYVDGVKMLIITDTSTRMAAFRTAKIDGTSGDYDDVKEFLRNPDINYMSYTVDYSMCIYMRTDKADLPLSKKEVRQALHMAINFDQIKDEFYEGKAVILNWPIAFRTEYADAYVPLDKLPANVQELWSHNITKAKELLTAAGYPNGFTTSIITYNTPTYVDYLSLVKSMWAEIGVTLNINAVELAVYSGRARTRNYDEMFYYYSSAIWQKMLNFSGVNQYNGSYVDDEKCNKAASDALMLIGVDDNKITEMFVDIVPYVLEQAWVISKPSPYTYVIWWPWVKNWNGELNVGYYNSPSYVKYRWQDVALKQQMTGQK